MAVSAPVEFHLEIPYIDDIKFRVNELIFSMFYGNSPLQLADHDQGYRVLNADNLDELVVTTNYLAFEYGVIRTDVRRNFITKEDVRSRLRTVKL